MRFVRKPKLKLGHTKPIDKVIEVFLKVLIDAVRHLAWVGAEPLRKAVEVQLGVEVGFLNFYNPNQLLDKCWRISSCLFFGGGAVIFVFWAGSVGSSSSVKSSPRGCGCE